MSIWAFLLLHLRWVIALAICVIGLVALGPSDLLRFSLIRTSAIAGVCFRQSLRRRVLWLAPLAILGLLIVAQFQRPLDEFDAVRQSVKYCLFASGLLAVLTTVILVCTNLPGEIESRVIYTIVTKPATRLEIMVGKVAGFSAVSAAILLIMGLFTFAYLEVSAHRLQAQIPQRLSAPVGEAQRQSLEHYREQGLLHANTYEEPGDGEVFAQMPQPQDPVRWFYGEHDEEILAPYDISQAQLPLPNEPSQQQALWAQQIGWVIEIKVPHHPVGAQQGDWTPLLPHLPASTRPIPEVFSLNRPQEPGIQVQILGPDAFDLVPGRDIDHLDLTPGKPPAYVHGGAALLPPDAAADPCVRFWVRPQCVDKIRQVSGDPRRIYVMFYTTAPGWFYAMSPTSVSLYQVAAADLADGRKWQAMPHGFDAQGKPVWERWPISRGCYSSLGTQLRGSDNPALAPIGVFPFAIDPRSLDLSGGRLPFEMRIFVQRTGGEAATDVEDQTLVEVCARNARTGEISDPQTFIVESNRPAFFSIPAAAVAGGKFELLIRCLTSGHILWFREGVLQAVVAQHCFLGNLVKSLLVLWLLSLLVAIVALFSSTFVSWPIAIMLSLVILLGRWGMQQIGDTNTLSVGRTIVAQMFPDADPAVVQTFTSSVQGLAGFENRIAQLLPDISQFAATEAINRGIDISYQVIWASLKELLLFGLPLGVVGYVVFKRKEVAP